MSKKTLQGLPDYAQLSYMSTKSEAEMIAYIDSIQIQNLSKTEANILRLEAYLSKYLAIGQQRLSQRLEEIEKNGIIKGRPRSYKRLPRPLPSEQDLETNKKQQGFLSSKFSSLTKYICSFIPFPNNSYTSVSDKDDQQAETAPNKAINYQHQTVPKKKYG